MHFRIRGQEPGQFRHLTELSEDLLAARGARRAVADEKPGYPCRVTLADAEIGESVLLVNFQHQSAATPYRASGPIFVREAAMRAFDAVDAVPPMLLGRLLSVRAYDEQGMMLDADVTEGTALTGLIGRFFGAAETAYLHAHFARRGCFACRIDRE
jgi:Protein of unknown function (DUF1203)